MTAAVGLPTLRLIRVSIDLMDGGDPLSLAGLATGQWRLAEAAEALRLGTLLASPGRGGRAGGGKSGRAGGG
jgi:23S rRNA pseudouridine2457 synthase